MAATAASLALAAPAMAGGGDGRDAVEAAGATGGAGADGAEGGARRRLATAGEAHELALLPPAAWDGWIALLHYRTTGRTADRDGEGWRSEVPTPTFFLDEEGRFDPEREWLADRRAFLQPVAASAPETAARHAQCRFPARFAFMKAQLGWRDAEVPRVECVDLRAFERKLGARSLAVVFASHYLANPASAFGHTMLYVGSSPTIDPRETKLADSSIGFEADVQGRSALGYIPKGLVGGLTAGFRMRPFYDRVRKYERQELRDIWLFPLQVSQGDLDQLVRHTWELQDVSYQYGFFGENCAQKILAIVHAVAPRYRVLPFESAAVLPSDVVRRLVDRMGLGGEPVLRPSLLGRYERARAALSEAERGQLDRMIEARSVPADAPAGVLAAALLWSELKLPYRTFRRAADAAAAPAATDSSEHPDLRWRRALLTARATRSGGAAVGGASGAAGNDAVEAWHRATGPSLLDSHAPSRFTVRGGVRDDVAAFGAGARWLLHEPLDPEAGYPSLSSLEVLRIDLGVTAEGTGFVDEATAIRLEKLAPASSLQSPLTWKLEVGARRLPYDDGTHLHVGAEAAVGLGAATRGATSSFAVYTLLGLRPGALLSRDGARFAPATLGTAGLLARLGPLRARLHGESSFSLRSLTFETAVTATLRLALSCDLDLELLSTSDQDRTITAALGLVMFR